jgi:hypothetical protein
MTYIIKINVEETDKHFVEELLAKLGCEVTEEKKKQIKVKKRPTALSPTLLFGKWKNVDLNPSTFRKELWSRKK